MHSFSWKNPLRLIRLRREYEKEILLGLTLALSLGTFFCLIGCGNTSGEADASNSLEEAVEITVESDLDESETSAKVATTEPELEATDNAGTGETEGALVAASQSDWVGDWTVVCTKVRRGKVGEEPETTTVFSGFIINSVLINDDLQGPSILMMGSLQHLPGKYKIPTLSLLIVLMETLPLLLCVL